MYHAAMSGKTEIMEMLVANGGGEGVSSALHGAIAFGHVEVVRWLLEHGADTSAMDWQGKSPVQAALDGGHTEIAQLLQAAGS